MTSTWRLARVLLCAWVLWLQEAPWRYLDTYDTRAACEAQLHAYAQDARLRADLLTYSGLVAVYQCLPVGLHPRDTEGGGQRKESR